VEKPKRSDVRVTGVTTWLIPVETRVPLKFGHEVLTSVTCLRVRLDVTSAGGTKASGWGETPLSVQWVWPSDLAYDERHRALIELSLSIAGAWSANARQGDPFELGHGFQQEVLPGLLEKLNAGRAPREPMPWLAALVCASAFDIALHDAFGVANALPVYETYNGRFLNRDLSAYIEPEEKSSVSFAGRFPG